MKDIEKYYSLYKHMYFHAIRMLVQSNTNIQKYRTVNYLNMQDNYDYPKTMKTWWTGGSHKEEMDEYRVRLAHSSRFITEQTRAN